METLPVRRTARALHDIDPIAFQHPHDLAATESLRRIPLLPRVQHWLEKNITEGAMNQLRTANCIRLGPTQGRRLYDAFLYAAEVLDVRRLPRLYLMNSPMFNAFASGVEDYSITLTSGLVDALDEDEILGIIGHELGHIKCDHMLYKNLANFISEVGLQVLDRIFPGLGQAALLPLAVALLHWSRMAEFSCDRAGLLVTQDVDTVSRMTMMLAAGSKKILPDLNVEAVLEQAEQYKTGSMTWWEKLIIVKEELGSTHPVPVLRCREIRLFAASEQYRALLRGEYTRVGVPVLRRAGPALRTEEPFGRVCTTCDAIVADRRFCATCGRNLKEADRVCTTCLSAVAADATTCPRCVPQRLCANAACRVVLDEDARFCPACGTAA